MTHLQLSILVALTAEPLNGYGIIAQIRQDTESIGIPSHQSVYQALASLERAKNIEIISATQRERRYQLTARGLQHLKSQQLWLELTLRALKRRS